MKKRSLTLLSVLGTVFLLFALARSAAAEMMFDPQHYKELVDASSSETIPPGTKITVQNWQQYRRFMPMWLQAAFRGDYHWHIGPGPEFTIDVEATKSWPLPKKFLEDTEKFKDQVQLEKTSWGGYLIKGYTAGVPFPNPSEPNMAVKLMYNGWLPFRPFVSRYVTLDYIVDHFGNVSNEGTDDTFFEMAYLSDEGYPNATPAAAGGYFQAGHYIVTSPEQSKYLNDLQLQPKDPSKLQELYVFLPSLRRVLRLSSAARCTPLLGTDYIADDGAWLPPNFAPTFLGEKKVITMFMDPDKAYQPSTYMGGTESQQGTFPGWPKAGTNHWEIRDMYVVDLLALPILGSYCYSHRIYFVDKENWNIAPTGAENYDRSGKLYKILWLAQAPIKFRGQVITYAYATGMSMAMDFQNEHTTWNWDTPVQIDDGSAGPAAVPPEYRDPVMATPASLQRVMK